MVHKHDEVGVLQGPLSTKHLNKQALGTSTEQLIRNHSQRAGLASQFHPILLRTTEEQGALARTQEIQVCLITHTLHIVLSNSGSTEHH